MDGRVKPGHDAESPSVGSLRLRERSDDAGRALGMPVQRLDELVSRHAGLERIGLEVGGDQGEGVVVRRAGGRAGAEIMRQTHQLLPPVYLSVCWETSPSAKPVTDT